MKKEVTLNEFLEMLKEKYKCFSFEKHYDEGVLYDVEILETRIYIPYEGEKKHVQNHTTSVLHVCCLENLLEFEVRNFWGDNYEVDEDSLKIANAIKSFINGGDLIESIKNL